MYFYIKIKSLLAVLLVTTSLVGQMDTVKLYHQSVPAQSQELNAYSEVVARFDLDKTSYLQGLRFHVISPTNSQFVCDIYGQEGGLSIPQLHKKLTPSQTISVASNAKAVDVTFDDAIALTGDQFFISISQTEGELYILKDTKTQNQHCDTEDGGTYTPTLLKGKKRFRYKKSDAFLQIDLIFNNKKEKSEVSFVDVTTELLGSKPIYAHAISFGDLNQDKVQDLIIGSLVFIGDVDKPYRNTVKKNRLPLKNWGGKNLILDIDNDHDLDILFFWRKRNFIFTNNGKMIFKSNPTRMPQIPYLSSISYGDVNADGHLDLFLGQTWAYYPKPAANYFYLNDGHLNFIDSTKQFYPEHLKDKNFPNRTLCDSLNIDNCLFDVNYNTRTKESQFTDIDNDGDLDLIVANYFLEADEYYEQYAEGQFKRKDIEGFNLSTRPALPQDVSLIKEGDSHGYHSTGIDVRDMDHDGAMDILLSQLAHPLYIRDFGHRPSAIYLNVANRFDLNTSGIEFEETHSSVSSGDVNNDGLVDLFYTAYYGCRYADLYIQDHQHTFTNVSNSSGLSKLSLDDDACFVDYNSDGLLDLITKQDGFIKIYKNTTQSDNNWIKIKLKDNQGNSEGIGCKVSVAVKKKKLTEEMGLVKGKLIQGPHILHFGLGKEKPKEVLVEWSKGDIEKFKNLEINSLNTLVRGTGKK